MPFLDIGREDVDCLVDAVRQQGEFERLRRQGLFNRLQSLFCCLGSVRHRFKVRLNSDCVQGCSDCRKQSCEKRQVFEKVRPGDGPEEIGGNVISENKERSEDERSEEQQTSGPMNAGLHRLHSLFVADIIAKLPIYFRREQARSDVVEKWLVNLPVAKGQRTSNSTGVP